MHWEPADQILRPGPTDMNLSSGGIPQLWLLDLQVRSHHADSRQWEGKKKSKNNKQNVSDIENLWRECGFNSQQSPWKHLTTMGTNETLFGAIAFLLEIESAVGLLLLLLFIFISN